MIKSILVKIGGIEHYGIISTCLFLFVFVGMLIWAFSLKKSHLENMASAALDQEPEDLQSKESHE
jgi:hypothetical protein